MTMDIGKSGTRGLGLGRLLLLAGVCGGAISASAAYAQVDEIVITAQKREASIQDVPLSVMAVSGEQLEKLRIDNFQDIGTAFAGINFNFGDGPTGSFGRRSVGIRGVRPQAGLTLNSVGFYIDETPVNIVETRIFDIDRIEVLRGPQGTLYGSGSVGGTIRILTNQPDPTKFDAAALGDISTTKGGGENWSANAMINIPLATDKAALRIVGYYRDQSGYIDNVAPTPGLLKTIQSGIFIGLPADTPVVAGEDRGPADALVDRNVNDQEVYGIRASMLLRLSDDLEITPSIYHQKLEVGGGQDFAPQLGSGFKRVGFVETKSEEKFTLASLAIKYATGIGEIVSTTSYFESKNRARRDITPAFTSQTGDLFCVFDAVCSPGMFTQSMLMTAYQDSYQLHRSWTHETRFVSSFDGPFQLTAGVFYEDQKRPFDNIFASMPTAAGAFLYDAGTTGFGATLDSFIIPFLSADGSFLAGDVRAKRNLEQYAVFGEATYNVTEKLDVTAGLRYYHFKNETADDFRGFLFNRGGIGNTGKSSGDGFNPMVSASYHVSDDHMLYARAAKGFRVGGANIPLSDTCLAQLGGPASDYDADTLWNYEAGAKTSWLDRKLTVNGAFYYIKWKNIQTNVPFGFACGIDGYIENGADARSMGTELEVAANLAKGLDVTAAVAYIDAEFTEDSTRVVGSVADPSAGIDKGDSLTLTPKWTGSASVQYSTAVSSGLDAYLRYGLTFRSKSETNFSTLLPVRTEGYVESDVRLGLTGKRYEVSLFVDNLFDVDPIVSPNSENILIGAGQQMSVSIRPRTIGISAKLKLH